MDPDRHSAEVERSFTAQADAFEDADRNQVFTADARWAFDRLPLRAEDLVLDVAAGTGHAARQLAPAVRAVVAVDATAAMLARGQAAAAAEGVTNIVYLRHHAEALPFLDGSFDVAVCRFALHHLQEPSAVIAEMVRCTRPGGYVALVDLLGDPDPAVAARQDELERRRDRSHARLLSERALRDAVAEAGLELLDLTVRTLRRPLGPWLAQTAPGPDAEREIEAALAAELRGGPVTGLRPERGAHDLSFTQTFGAAVARRPR